MRELWGAFAVALVACGGGRETPTEGRGTAACRIWQDSVCDWADRCESALTREKCDVEYQGVVCRSDDMANQCARAFDSANCQAVPAWCGLDEIADPAPAAKACGALRSLMCRRSITCGASTTEAACMKANPIDCSLAIAFTLDYESCIDSVQMVDCDVLVPEGTLVPPELCLPVIVSKQPTRQN
jgi:hypothetical protein